MNWILDYSFNECKLVDLDSSESPFVFVGNQITMGYAIRGLVGSKMITMDVTGLGLGFSEYLKRLGMNVRGVR